MAATVGAAALIAFTNFGLLGLSLVLVALGLMFVSREMPARTATGTAVLRAWTSCAGSAHSSGLESDRR